MNRNWVSYRRKETTSRRLIGKIAALATLIIVFGAIAAQSRVRPPQVEKPSPPAATAADVASMESIVAALYDVISGPAGKKRDWDRMRSLFIPGARLIPTGKRQSGEISSRVLTVEDYINGSAKPLEENGFFEKEISRRSERYSNIAHVFSTYESRRKSDDVKPFARGINSFQLMNDGKRWWIVTVFWQGESPDSPLPDKYLTK